MEALWACVKALYSVVGLGAFLVVMLELRLVERLACNSGQVLAEWRVNCSDRMLVVQLVDLMVCEMVGRKDDYSAAWTAVWLAAATVDEMVAC
jgi:hypothetical protein